MKNKLHLTASRIDNIAGLLASDQSTLLSANQITNQSIVSSQTFSARDKISSLDAKATIQSNGSVQINSNKFTDTAGVINVSGDLNMKVAGDISFNNIAIKNKRFTNEGNWGVDTSSTNNEVSHINVGGNTQIISDKVIRLIGTKAKLNGNAEILASLGYIQTSVVNRESKRKKKVEHGNSLFGSTETQSTINSSKQTNQLSTLDVAGNLNIETKGNINF